VNVDISLVVRKELVVPLAQADAFRLFTAGMGSWWPVTSHSIAGRPDISVEFEERVGGHIRERLPDGNVADWAEITEWDPPAGFVCRWYPGHPESEATTLTVSFDASGDNQTRVELIHTGWEVFGTEAVRRYGSYASGWDPVLAEYLTCAG
jgi:hypothetical protein